jgi:acyl carrier protein
VSTVEPIDYVREILAKHGRLSADVMSLAPADDLYAVGLTSLTTVHIMLALEDQFGVEFPDRLLGRKTFGSIQSIVEAVEELVG